MSEFKIGDRVISTVCGKGTIIGFYPSIEFLVQVKFDKKPDVRYNMAENPTCMLIDDVKKLETGRPADEN